MDDLEPIADPYSHIPDIVLFWNTCGYLGRPILLSVCERAGLDAVIEALKTTCIDNLEESHIDGIPERTESCRRMVSQYDHPEARTFFAAQLGMM